MRNKIRILNLLALILLIVPAFYLDPFRENYSHLTIFPLGHFYVLVLAASIGITLYLELAVSSKRQGLVAFFCFMVPALVAYDEPATLQANIHILLSYAGFYAIAILHIFNLYMKSVGNAKRLLFARRITVVLFSITIYSYLNFLCVNTLSELSFASGILVSNYLLYIEKTTA
ncbi:MAG: hypothetical protein PUD22_05160 [Erysipelotrichaceae bacterium]|nr:hypothetical protein [Erysipelotrichaceae bacterium]